MDVVDEMRISDELMCRSVRINTAIERLENALIELENDNYMSVKFYIERAKKMLEIEKETIDALILEECEKLQSL